MMRDTVKADIKQLKYEGNSQGKVDGANDTKESSNNQRDAIYKKFFSNFNIFRSNSPELSIDGNTPNLSSRVCKLCFEYGAVRRKCCKALYCDHCYVKNEKCPNCQVQTKREKLTGATYQLKVFSEVEECRTCLDPGLKRPCCGNYYCDKCFYSSTICRSCSTPVGNPNDNKGVFAVDPAYAISIAIGWIASILLVLGFISFIGIVIAASNQTPLGIWGYHCYGFFRSCSRDVCVGMTESVAMGTSALPPLSSWQKCTLDDPVKLRAATCVYDQHLYYSSDRLLGYDVCASEYNQGVVIFEDMYDAWNNVSFKSNRMKSATWDTVKNGYANSFCRSYSGAKSLYFGGELLRYAETNDLDISSGGRVSTMIFFPPIGFDVSDIFCKTGYIGTVNIEYSIDHGMNWTIISSYIPSLYRQPNFFRAEVELPERSWTNATRIRFIQPVFDSSRDNWALDDTMVIRYLPKDWQSNAEFFNNKRTAWLMIQEAQCCLDTDWCQKRMTRKDRDQLCSDLFSWYNGTVFLFRLAEVIVIVTALVNLTRFVYISLYDFLVRRGRIPFQDEVSELLTSPVVSSVLKLLPIQYRPFLKPLVDEFTDTIHQSARLEVKVRNLFDDGEAQGAMLKRREDAEQERKEYEKKIRKQKKKLQKRAQMKNFKASTIVVEEDKMFVEDLETNVLAEDTTKAIPGFIEEQLQFAEVDAVPDSLEKMRRQDLKLLRIPFHADVDEKWVFYFTVSTFLCFIALFVTLLSITSDYELEQRIWTFGFEQRVITIDSIFIVFIAAYNDLKEIFYTLKYIVPCRKRWRPVVTVDLSEDIRSILVNDSQVPLGAIREMVSYPETFIRWCALCAGIGVLPWSILSLIIRQTTLSYAAMRFTTPIFGIIMIARALTGPMFALKIAFTIQQICSYHFSSRAAIGSAVQKESTINMAYNFALGFACLGGFICASVAIPWFPIAFASGLAGGFVFGIFTGTAHELPIKPWMYITALRSGLWMRLRRKHTCPFVYWGSYCTELHNYDEVFVLMTTDDIRLTDLINHGLISDLNL